MYKILLFLLLFSSLKAFESTNLQLLYSNKFDGNSFVYDTLDKKKTTVTFEHFRTFSIGDMYMFVDLTDGGGQQGSYTEISPRLSMSKIANKDFSFSIVSDIYLATQLNVGNNYKAYLVGVGVDLKVPYFTFVNIAAYHKNVNINSDETFQVTAAYKTNPLYNIHLEGFIDYTNDSETTHNQLLYNIKDIFKSKEQLFVGTEWIYYNNSDSQNTSVIQAMIKLLF